MLSPVAVVFPELERVKTAESTKSPTWTDPKVNAVGGVTERTAWSPVPVRLEVSVPAPVATVNVPL